MDEELKVVTKSLQEALNQYDPEYVGKITMNENDGSLTLLDGKLTVQASILHDQDIHPSIAHVHVLSKIDAFPDNPLNACVIGISENRYDALSQAGRTWGTMAGDPILSLCHAVALGEATHFCGDEAWGVRGCHGFVGPVIVRMAGGKNLDLETISRSAMFDHVAELTPGGLLHIAKVTISNNGKGGWKRELEINGHEVGYANDPWELGIPLPNSEHLIISRFAVYHYTDRPDVSAGRQNLDDAIMDYVESLQEDANLDPTDVSDVLVNKGYHEDLVYWLDHFIPLAFGRIMLMDIGIRFPDTYFLAHEGGRLSGSLELIRNPAFARAHAMGWHFRASADYHNAFERAAVSSAEFNALNNALHKGSKPEELTAQPPLIPDISVNQEDYWRAMELYLAQYQSKQEMVRPTKKKAWWQFWK